MTRHPEAQSEDLVHKLVSVSGDEQQVFQEPVAYSDFFSTDGGEGDDETHDSNQEGASLHQSPEIAFRTKSFQSELNLLQYTGLSRNEYTSIWTRLGTPHNSSGLSLGEVLGDTGDRKVYEFVKPVLCSLVPSGEQQHKHIVHHSRAPKHSGVLGITRIPAQLADPEVLIQLGYSFTMEREQIEIAQALDRHSIDEIVDMTDKARAGQANMQSEAWELTSLVVVVIHHGPAHEQFGREAPVGTGDPEALHELELLPKVISQPDQTKDGVKSLSGANDRPIRRVPNSRSLAGTSVTGFHTSRSLMSKNSYKTAPGGPGLHELARKRLQENSQYAQLLRSRDLWPVDPSAEQDWSGRGQHVEFSKNDRSLINDILVQQDVLGSTTGTIVESVKCRRILLARKTITCNRKFTKEQAIEEVAHMTRLEHAHILRVVGTYVLGKSLSILLYPVAQYNLEEYLDTIVSPSVGRRQWMAMVQSCRTFFACLSNTISYIHSMFMKHLDIKPHNILVQRKPKSSWSVLEYPYTFTIYIADFGVSRSYPRADLIETDGKICFTRKYAAPEVASLDRRGLPADIFSLGCVFLEMYLALCDASTGNVFHDNLANLQNSGSGYDKLKRLQLQDKLEATHARRLQALLETSPDGISYQANLDMLREHYLGVTTALDCSDLHLSGKTFRPKLSGALRLLIALMMSSSPSDRPTAVALRKLFVRNLCCGEGPCQLEAMNENSDEEDVSDEGFEG